MNITPALSQRTLEIIRENFRVDDSDKSSKYFLETFHSKKKVDLRYMDGEGLTLWNVWYNKPPFIEYAGKDDSMTPKVAAVNNALRDLFAPAA